MYLRITCNSGCAAIVWFHPSPFLLRYFSFVHYVLYDCSSFSDDSVLKSKANKAEEILDHLNAQEPGIIKFTKEEEEDNKLSALDLEMNVNRKRKIVKFNMHYKTTNTNITLKKQSNHQENTKKGVIKGYGDRARALCDPQYLQGELQNIEDVFVENGYSRKEVQNAMKERQPAQDNTEEGDTEEP